MKKILAALPILLAMTLSTRAGDAPAPKVTLESSVEVLEELVSVPAKAIPNKLLADAEAVAVIPKVIKAGLIVGGSSGHGVIVIKDKNGGWGEVRFLKLGGASVGLQIGVQSTDVVLVFKTRKGLDRLLEGKKEVTLGADAAIAAGPVGREANASTDAQLKAEIFSYSRSRGAFAGVALDGIILQVDRKTTEQFEKNNEEEPHKAADNLKMKLAVLTTGKVNDIPPKK